SCPSPPQRPKYARPCVPPPLRTWRRKGNALLRIASDSACRVDPFDKPKGNWINCVRGGRHYSLQAQGDFCGTAKVQALFRIMGQGCAQSTCRSVVVGLLEKPLSQQTMKCFRPAVVIESIHSHQKDAPCGTTSLCGRLQEEC